MNLTILPTLSDAGLCTSVNGISISEMYHNVNDKMKEFKNILGSSHTSLFNARKIGGSGNIHQKKLWINVRDVTQQKETKGIVSVAINEWRDPVSVRCELLCYVHLGAFSHSVTSFTQTYGFFNPWWKIICGEDCPHSAQINCRICIHVVDQQGLHTKW
jgi:hypothetical protein